MIVYNFQTEMGESKSQRLGPLISTAPMSWLLHRLLQIVHVVDVLFFEAFVAELRLPQESLQFHNSFPEKFVFLDGFTQCLAELRAFVIGAGLMRMGVVGGIGVGGLLGKGEGAVVGVFVAAGVLGVAHPVDAVAGIFELLVHGN